MSPVELNLFLDAIRPFKSDHLGIVLQHRYPNYVKLSEQTLRGRDALVFRALSKIREIDPSVFSMHLEYIIWTEETWIGEHNDDPDLVGASIFEGTREYTKGPLKLLLLQCSDLAQHYREQCSEFTGNQALPETVAYHSSAIFLKFE